VHMVTPATRNSWSRNSGQLSETDHILTLARCADSLGAKALTGPWCSNATKSMHHSITACTVMAACCRHRFFTLRAEHGFWCNGSEWFWCMQQRVQLVEQLQPADTRRRPDNCWRDLAHRIHCPLAQRGWRVRIGWFCKAQQSMLSHQSECHTTVKAPLSPSSPFSSFICATMSSSDWTKRHSVHILHAIRSTSESLSSS
jgi:hypothetical protein